MESRPLCAGTIPPLRPKCFEMLPRPLARLSPVGRFLRLAAVAATVVSLGACATTTPTNDAKPAPGAPPPSAYETFDAVWTTINDKHCDHTHHAVDWVAARAEYRPRVAEVRTDDALRDLLEAMLGRLGQSHFVIIP